MYWNFCDEKSGERLLQVSPDSCNAALRLLRNFVKLFISLTFISLRLLEPFPVYLIFLLQRQTRVMLLFACFQISSNFLSPSLSSAFAFSTSSPVYLIFLLQRQFTIEFCEGVRCALSRCFNFIGTSRSFPSKCGARNVFDSFEFVYYLSNFFVSLRSSVVCCVFLIFSVNTFICLACLWLFFSQLVLGTQRLYFPRLSPWLFLSFIFFDATGFIFFDAFTQSIVLETMLLLWSVAAPVTFFNIASISSCCDASSASSLCFCACRCLLLRLC